MSHLVPIVVGAITLLGWTLYGGGIPSDMNFSLRRWSSAPQTAQESPLDTSGSRAELHRCACDE